MPWDEVRMEMVEEKGLDEKSADAIGRYVKMSGSDELIDQLLEDPKLNENESTRRGLEDLKLVFHYAIYLDCSSSVRH